MKKVTIIVMAGVFVGAIVGYLHYRYVGCFSDSCDITSKPFNGTLYGMLTGGLLFSIIVTSKK